MNLIDRELDLSHHYIGINSTIPFYLIINNDENTKTYHSPNDYQIDVWSLMLKEKFPNQPAWRLKVRYDSDLVIDENTIVFSSYDVDLANNTAGAKQVTVLDGGQLSAIQNVANVASVQNVDSVVDVANVASVQNVDSVVDVVNVGGVDNIRSVDTVFKTKNLQQFGFKYFKSKADFRDYLNILSEGDIIIGGVRSAFESGFSTVFDYKVESLDSENNFVQVSKVMACNEILFSGVFRIDKLYVSDRQFEIRMEILKLNNHTNISYGKLIYNKYQITDDWTGLGLWGSIISHYEE